MGTADRIPDHRVGHRVDVYQAGDAVLRDPVEWWQKAIRNGVGLRIVYRLAEEVRIQYGVGTHESRRHMNVIEQPVEVRRQSRTAVGIEEVQ